MGTSKELFNAVQAYYKSSDSAYRNWGPDPEIGGVYAIHLGFHNEGQGDIDNHTAVKQMTRKVVEACKIKPGQRILDAGCGSGSIAFEIAYRHPATEVHGINIVLQQLQSAEQSKVHGKPNQPNFSQQDYLKTGFKDGSFDRIIFCESLAHAENKKLLMGEAYRILRADGMIFIADCFSKDASFNDQEKDYLNYFKIGMGIPDIIPLEEFLEFLSETGYGNIQLQEVTENVLPSVLLGSTHAEMRLRQEADAPEEVTNGRLAVIGIEKLMSGGQVGYYFINASK